MPHMAIEVAREARDHAQPLDADCIVAIGGGSTIDPGKTITLEIGSIEGRSLFTSLSRNGPAVSRGSHAAVTFKTLDSAS
ncbi:iron-containing alcohol dehydrogenase [Paraburkholderia sp. GAS448]|uniref:iron-containing alcohol dehydrogenase n=1 Tax=Paraburkholderia sp. GAS448 TaxID=3035136 RepID=UPI003D1A6E27